MQFIWGDFYRDTRISEIKNLGYRASNLGCMYLNISFGLVLLLLLASLRSVRRKTTSRLALTRFPALGTGYVYLLQGADWSILFQNIFGAIGWFLASPNPDSQFCAKKLTLRKRFRLRGLLI